MEAATQSSSFPDSPSSSLMTKSCIPPLNTALLRDDATSSVFLRSRSSGPQYLAEGPCPSGTVWLPSMFSRDSTMTIASQVAEDRPPNIYGQALVGSQGDLGLSPTRIGGKRRKSESVAFSHVRRDRDEVHIIVKRGRAGLVGGEIKTAIQDAIADEKRQRELRRLRQIRYRKKKDWKAQNLEKETKQLEREVLKLEQRLRTLSSTVPARETLWNVVVQYFHMFRDGYRASSQSLTISAVDSCAYMKFLQEKTASDVIHQNGSGPESLLKQWKRVSLWFNDIKYRLVCLEQDSDDSLVATTTTSFTITETTLLKVFPQLCNAHGQHENSHLAAKLLGERIVVRGTTRFVWDCAFGWVTHLVEEADMLTPMLQILGNPEDVAVVFNGSRIQPNFQSTDLE